MGDSINLKNKYPFWYFEHCSIFRKDSNIILKSEENEIEIPFDKIGMLLLGVGVSISSNVISHAVKYKTNIAISTSSQVPTAVISTKGFMGSGEIAYNQAIVCINKNKRLEKAKYLVSERFPNVKEKIYSCKNIRELQGVEGASVRETYKSTFGITFKRFKEVGDDNVKDLNLKLNIANNALYNLLQVVCIEYGLSPHLSIIHGKKRNSFIYDLSDVFKTKEYYLLIKKSKDIKTMLTNLSEYFYNKFFFVKIEEIILNVFNNTKREQISNIWIQSESFDHFGEKFEDY